MDQESNVPSCSSSMKGSTVIEVKFLDDSITRFRVKYKALGKWLMEQVIGMLNVKNSKYFGLEYYDSDRTRYWLNPEKSIYRQLSLDLDRPIMYFGVKFYHPDPSKIEDEHTRHLFCLQIKKDLSEGSLQCNENIGALIASYIIQSEIGNFNPDKYIDPSYLSSFPLIPHQDAELEWKIQENHKEHIGLTIAQSDYYLLETASKLDYYGVKLTPVKGCNNIPLNIAVNHVGILIFQNDLAKISPFIWSRIRKLSFKRKRFLLKLHDDDIVEFAFESRNKSKNFWRKCIEQHTFFRGFQVKSFDQNQTKLFDEPAFMSHSGHQQSSERASIQEVESPFENVHYPEVNGNEVESEEGESEEQEDSNLRYKLNEEYVKDLCTNIIGMDKILEGSRQPWFLRQGCLLKLSRKGYQKRMFFLFNGILVYCTRSKVNNTFKVHGNLLLENVMIEETKPTSIPNSAIPIQLNTFGFTVYAGDRALMVASMSQSGREDWIRGINQADSLRPPMYPSHHLSDLVTDDNCINVENTNGNDSLNNNCKKDQDDDPNGSFAKEILSQIESVLSGEQQPEPIYVRNNLSKETNGTNSSPVQNQNQCSNVEEVEQSVNGIGLANGGGMQSIHESINTTWNPFSCHTLTHLCWDRDSYITLDQYVSAYTTNLSGYLLRKFKSSSGWQKLWVTFTQFSLFFYKSHQDEDPIANLPLLGYSLCLPSDDQDEEAGINKKNYVFKLYFKSHVYYFRTEDEESFYQWMDSLQTCCR